MKKLYAFVLTVCCALCVFAGCGKDKAAFTSKQRNFYAMDTSAALVVSDNFNDEKKAADYNRLCISVADTLSAFEDSLSATNENSSVARFNAASAGEKLEIDKTAYDVIKLALQVYRDTDGYYNPAVWYSVQDYGFFGLFWLMTPENLPAAADVEKYVRLSEHFGETALEEADGKYYVTKPQATVEVGGQTLSMKIDLGGIGKGYAVDKIDLLLSEYGFNYGYFDFGSSSIACKKFYNGDAYKLGFKNPRAENISDTYLQTTLLDEKLSTSGDFERFYELDGTRYCHVIDPTTGAPVQKGIMSATVIGGSAAENDAYTTAIMAMGKERAVEFINAKISKRRVAFTVNEGGAYKIITNIPEGGYTVTNPAFSVADGIFSR